jgi:charged multivesicular body protein 2A
MGNLWAAPPTPQEMLKENKKAIRKGIRELDREVDNLSRDEMKMQQEIRVNAKKGQHQLVRLQVKELIRSRNAVLKLGQAKIQLQGVLQQLQLVNTTAVMAEALRSATVAMRRMNRQMNLPVLQNIMKDFEKQGAIMEMKQDMMDDTINDSVGQPDDEEREEELINQVLDEIGINIASNMADTPLPGRDARHDQDPELIRRLEELRKP